ncbi:Peptidyl-prolyl cis-trans isomerase CYP40, partial [Bienertia sinuspersici]
CFGDVYLGEPRGEGVRFHRILKGALIQGSDISGGGESGGESIYGEKFDDENFQLRHERKGMLSMVNTGPNTNGSQFFITTTQTHQFSGNHVVFGIVIKGWALFNCGEIPEGDDYGVINFFKDGDTYPDWPSDLDSKSDDFTWWVTAAEGIKVFGNQNFKKQDYKMAIRKYLKAMRYMDMCWDMESLDGGDHFRKASYL